MQITLARHGRPLVAIPTTLRAEELQGWYARYNAAGLDLGLAPPTALVALAAEAGHVLCSDLRRSVESARRVAPAREPEIDALFREPTPPTPPAWLGALGWRAGGLAFWMLWIAGRGGDGESLASARRRARQAAHRLVQAAAEHERVLFVGHGLINGLIARELRRQGWRGPRIPSRDFWDSASYHRVAP